MNLSTQQRRDEFRRRLVSTDLSPRTPTAWEAKGMAWWNALDEALRRSYLAQAAQALGRPASVADAYRYALKQIGILS